MNKKSTKLSLRFYFCLIFFGLVGQIAWVIENMYFATFAQDIFANSGRNDLSYIVTTLMVIFSALVATITTIFAGGLSDHLHKRKPFIAFGYMIWGFTIALFAIIPMKIAANQLYFYASLLVIFDCLMTFAGSTSNDAAFNAWVADNTNTTNRGIVNALLSIFPIFAVIIVFIGLGKLYSSQAESNYLFFIVLGIIPFISGMIALFSLKESPNMVISRVDNESYAQKTFYGFKPKVIKENKMLYITLIALCIVGIAQQTFFSYLINFLTKTLELGDGFVIPMAVIILCAALLTGVSGVLADKFSRKRFYYPLLILGFVGILSFFLIQYTTGWVKYFVLYVGGTFMIGSLFSLTGLLTGAFQDYIPEKCEGRFQGVRMCFSVLIPMIIGPIISLIIGLDAMGIQGEDFIPPYSMFLASAIVIVFAALPLYFVRKDDARIRKIGQEKIAEQKVKEIKIKN